MSDKPNILLICTDQQFAGAMSCAGNADLKTPAMDSLAESGVRFERAYCTHPLCGPMRTSIVTGLMPHTAGVTTNRTPIREDLPARSLGNLLGEAGYTCALAGKWHVIGCEPKDCGFDMICGTRDHQVPVASSEFLNRTEGPVFLFASFVNPHDICQIARNQRLPQGPIPEPASISDCPNLPANFSEPPYSPDILHEEKRWNPRIYPTANFNEVDWRRLRWGYYRLIEKVDAEIGRLLEALRASGREKDTLILFTSDHGDGHGSHHWNQKTALWEEEIRVPLIASGRGVAGNARTDARLASSGLDLLPTICDYAGANVPDDVQGVSLRPLLEDKAVEGWRKDLIIESQVAIGDGPGGRLIARAVVEDRYKYSVYAMGRNREQLVDLQADPGEMVNLAVERRYEPVLQACRERLRSWCKETDDAGVNLFA